MRPVPPRFLLGWLQQRGLRDEGPAQAHGPRLAAATAWLLWRVVLPHPRPRPAGSAA